MIYPDQQVIELPLSELQGHLPHTVYVCILTNVFSEFAKCLQHQQLFVIIKIKVLARILPNTDEKRQSKQTRCEQLLKQVNHFTILFSLYITQK